MLTEARKWIMVGSAKPAESTPRDGADAVCFAILGDPRNDDGKPCVSGYRRLSGDVPSVECDRKAPPEMPMFPGDLPTRATCYSMCHGRATATRRLRRPPDAGPRQRGSAAYWLRVRGTPAFALTLSCTSTSGPGCTSRWGSCTRIATCRYSRSWSPLSITTGRGGCASPGELPEVGVSMRNFLAGISARGLCSA